jgi:HK97 family phage portal protein
VKKQNDLARYKALTSSGFDASVMHKAQQIRKHSLVELDHTELHEVLKRPNPAQSYNAFIQEIIAFGKLTGNRYIFGIAPDTGMNKGKYKELYVLPSQNMEIHSGGIMDPVKEYTLSYNGTYRIAADDVCHIKDFNPYYDGTGSHLYGMSPLHSGLRVLQANNEAVTTGVKYLQNQTARGVLMSEEGDLSEEQARMLKQKFKEQNQGADKAGDLVITPKKLSWINFGLTTSDLSLIEQYNASIKDLCNIYSVPVQMLNNTDASTYNNMKEAKKALYQNAVIPELIKIREELNRWLTPKYGQNLYIDFDFSVIPELQEEMDKVVQQMSNAWWITPNEKRAAMSYGVDEDSAFMNDYYIPANLIPTQNLPDLIDEPETMPNASEPMGMGDDVFSTQEPAEARAAQLGGEGFHTHMTEAGETVFMPFATHEEYEAAINKGFFLTDREIKQEYTGYPQSATNNARRMLDWIEEYGRDVVTGGTQTGLARARQLSERRPLDRETINRIYSFFSRHEGNEVIDEQYRDEPWRDNGFVAWNLWGGTSMFNYVKEIVENED